MDSKCILAVLPTREQDALEKEISGRYRCTDTAHISNMITYKHHTKIFGPIIDTHKKLLDQVKYLCKLSMQQYCS